MSNQTFTPHPRMQSSSRGERPAARQAPVRAADSQSWARLSAATGATAAAITSSKAPSCEADTSPLKKSLQSADILESPSAGLGGSQGSDSADQVDRWARCIGLERAKHLLAADSQVQGPAKDARVVLLDKEEKGERLTTPAARLVQSARPMSPGEPVLDATVWTRQAMQRPPSRQKPPPEALHLFSSDASIWEGELVKRKGRPQTASGTTRRSEPKRLAVPFTGLTSMKRPISRHRPPPESLDLRAAAVAGP
jgi:hypothetical protein